jgi:hypothetical protein
MNTQHQIPLVLPNWSGITFDINGNERCQVDPSAIPDFGGSGVYIDDTGHAVVIKPYSRDRLPFKSNSPSKTYPVMLLPNSESKNLSKDIHPSLKGFNWNLVSSLPEKDKFVCSRKRECLDLVILDTIEGKIEDDDETASGRIKKTSRLNLEEEIVDIAVQCSNCLLYVNTHSKIKIVALEEESGEDSLTYLSEVFASRVMSSISTAPNREYYFKTATTNPFLKNELVSCLCSGVSSQSGSFPDSAFLKCTTDDIICLIDIDKGICKHFMNTKDIEKKSPLSTCYPSLDHPRHVFAADKDNMWLIDSRIQSPKTALKMISTECRQMYPQERLSGCLAFPLRPQQHLILSNYHVGLVDERFPSRILLQWSHSLDTDGKLSMNFLKFLSTHELTNKTDDEDTTTRKPVDTSAAGLTSRVESSTTDSCLVYMSNTSSVCMLSLEYLKGGTRCQPYSLHAPLHVFHLKEFVKRHSFSRCQEKQSQEKGESSKTGVTSACKAVFAGSCHLSSCLTGLDIVSSSSLGSMSSMIGVTERGDVMIQDFLFQSKSHRH